jgi:hypothetical protein
MDDVTENHAHAVGFGKLLGVVDLSWRQQVPAYAFRSTACTHRHRACVNGIHPVPWRIWLRDAASSARFSDQGGKHSTQQSSSRGQCICSSLSTHANRPARMTSRQASKHCLFHCTSFATDPAL